VEGDMLALSLFLACAPQHAAAVASPVDAAELRHESISSLEKLLASRTLTEQQRPEAMLRLAELYHDEARARFLEEQAQIIAHEPR
jgi:hypothetical protein